MKKFLLYSSLIAVTALLFGCGTTYITVEQFSEKVTKTIDEFTGLTDIRSLKFPLITGFGRYWFSARKGREDSEYTIYLYITAWRSGSLDYKIFDQLYDTQQSKFRTIHVNQREGNFGSIEEVLATVIPEDYIVEWLDDPNPRGFMLHGKGERCTFEVFPNEVRGFWEAYQRLK